MRSRESKWEKKFEIFRPLYFGSRGIQFEREQNLMQLDHRSKVESGNICQIFLIDSSSAWNEENAIEQAERMANNMCHQKQFDFRFQQELTLASLLSSNKTHLMRLPVMKRFAKNV